MDEPRTDNINCWINNKKIADTTLIQKLGKIFEEPAHKIKQNKTKEQYKP
jgi:hypothetical protein